MGTFRLTVKREDRVLSPPSFTLLLTFPEPVDVVPDVQRDKQMIAC